jgi:hypothetical protein
VGLLSRSASTSRDLASDLLFIKTAWRFLDRDAKQRARSVRVTSRTRELLAQPPLSPREQRARARGCSTSRLQYVEYLERHAPELAARVERGDITITEACRKVRAKLKAKAAAAIAITAK